MRSIGSFTRNIKTINRKILLMVVVFMLITSTVMATIGIYSIRKSTLNSLEINLKDTARASAQAMAADLENMKLMVHDIYKQSSNTASDVTSSATGQSTGKDLVIRTGKVNSQGITPEGEDLSKESFFKKAMATGEPVLGDMIVAGESDVRITVASPIYGKSGNIDDVYFIEYNGEILTALANKYAVGERGNAYILDKEGSILAYPVLQVVYARDNSIENAKTDKSVQPMADMVHRAIAGENSTSFYHYGGKDKVAAYALIDGTDGWSMIVSADESEFTGEINASIWRLVLAEVLLLLIAILISSMVSRRISEPIKKLDVVAKEMAEGNLSSNIEVIGRDESARLADSFIITRDSMKTYIGELGNWVNALAKCDLTYKSEVEFKGDFLKIKEHLEHLTISYRNMIDTIKSTTENINSISGQAARNSQLIAASTTEQAATMEEISSTMEELDSHARNNTEKTVGANEKSKFAGDGIRQCNSDMDDLMESIDAIDTSSREINNIIKTIGDIAFQTNILALNAAVESARAGEHGRGFSVVADEVRNLAIRSAEAAQSTEELINKTTFNIAKGNEIAVKTSEHLNEVVLRVDELCQLIDEIAEASKEQQVSIGQINSGIGQISDTIQSNSASSEESAALSQELHSHAKELEDTVQMYKI
ncbi:MAG: HAMP domain-containing protein [Bacteroidales bacterium]|nr:HAMP domain-containing protein [Bacteroidales bacterium]